jgi:hypothetical protein
VVSEPGLGEGDSVPSKDNIRLIEDNVDSADHLDVRNNENENLLREKRGLSVSKTLFFVLGDVAGTGRNAAWSLPAYCPLLIWNIISNQEFWQCPKLYMTSVNFFFSQKMSSSSKPI